LSFSSALPSRPAFRFHGDTVGYSIKPTPDRLPPGNRSGLTHQNEKRGLKGIVGVMAIVQDAAADAQDHRTMPLEQSFEGSFFVP
jgi:hypothetical protein